MPTDEEQIRQLVATWMEATMAGRVDAVLDLMADDVVFLVPGRAPMNKREFAAAAQSQAGPAAPKIDGRSEIQEIKVVGDWAFMWSKLAVAVRPQDGSRVEREGYALSVLRKENGKWLLARDANLLSPVKTPPA